MTCVLVLPHLSRTSHAHSSLSHLACDGWGWVSHGLSAKGSKDEVKRPQRPPTSPGSWTSSELYFPKGKGRWPKKSCTSLRACKNTTFCLSFLGQLRRVLPFLGLWKGVCLFLLTTGVVPLNIFLWYFKQGSLHSELVEEDHVWCSDDYWPAEVVEVLQVEVGGRTEVHSRGLVIVHWLEQEYNCFFSSSIFSLFGGPIPLFLLAEMRMFLDL